MAEESFSSKVKTQLMSELIKKKCCKHTFNDVIAAKGANDMLLIKSIYRNCRCDLCRVVFIRAMFIICGSVTNPEKAYHLDFSFKTLQEAELMSEILSETGIEFRQTVRRGNTVLYIKESSLVEDFLVYIGASNAAFDVMNSKIVREFRNSVNRQVNCDTANIEKQIAAGRKYKIAIEYLYAVGKYDLLSPELKEAVKLRLENEQLSLAELGSLANPPITKSGMKHRLEKIFNIAKDYGMEV